MKTVKSAEAERLGTQIRALRRSRGMTLVQLATQSDLSHPFLSQLERGLAAPSMTSLSAIARALGSSQLELMAGAADLNREEQENAPTLVRANEGDQGPYGSGVARLLVHGDRRFYPMIFDGSSMDRDEFHSHVEDEFVHVLEGQCTIDLGDQGTFELTPGDSLYYAGGTPHRWSSTTGEAFRLFVVKQHASLRAADGILASPALNVTVPHSSTEEAV
jgi:transcriptional regulator with XRE-family HTH domain